MSSPAVDWPAYCETLSAELGATFVSWRPQVRNSGGRSAYFAELERGGEPLHLYIRAGRDVMPDDRALADLAMEQTVMQWLDARGVAVAAPVHLSQRPIALAMQALQGRDDFLEISQSAEGEAVLSDYIRILADMHSHDVRELVAAGFTAPKPGVAVALQHFDEFALNWHRIGLIPRNPLCTWIDRWMTEHAPAYEGALSLVQGDTGPGNFVYADNKVVGLVDWDLAHLGDPMEDLGALRLRDVWTPFPGGVSRYFREYADRSGRELNEAAIQWYSIKLCMVHPFVLSIPYHYPHITQTPAEWVAEYFSLTRLGLEELALVAGVDLEPVDLPEAEPSLFAAYHDSLTTALRDEVVALIEEPFARYRAEQAWRTAMFLRGVERYLPAIHATEIDEVAAITGTRASTHPEAMSLLDDYVTTADVDAPVLVQFFYRQQSRMEALMPGAIGRSEGRHFTPLDLG